MKKRNIRIISLILVVLSIAAVFCVSYASGAKEEVTYIDYTSEVKALMSEATSFVLVRHKQLGASHYAYTEAVSDERDEYRFYPGSKLCRVTLSIDPAKPDKVKVTEEELMKSASGVIRDPDVSEDGTKIVFSYKESDTDDFHLYEMDLATKKKKQLTFGSGVADIEPVYTANGTIVFSSTRDVQTVDCWYTPVSNLYMCNADGSNITRLGYDQVHTTYPTTTTDGRVLYTRWDYNDRNQMYVQALFQMFPDGTLQTEVFGNNANNPTTLLHTREIPGVSYKYVTIISGHHMNQVGKIAVVDTSKGRNDRGAIDYVFEDQATKTLAGGASSEDSGLFQNGTVFKYPYAYKEGLYTVSMCKTYDGGNHSSPFDIVIMNSKGKTQTLVKSDGEYPASQMVPIQTEELFERSSMVNYAKDTGTYYIADVYQGEPMKGVKKGTAKYLRVVALSFRPYSIGATNAFGTGSADPYSPIATGNGAWDVKQVLGIVPIEADGSALFTVPSETPIYFQVLDKNGDLIQTMRSWSTLQPGESFSCIGCHVDKNTAPLTTLGTTQAMKKGVQTLQPDLWMETCEDYKDFDPYEDEYIGFDYLSVVQPILDKSCVTCHSNTEKAFSKIKVTDMNGKGTADKKGAETIFSSDTEWQFTKVDPGANWFKKEFNSSAWKSDTAPFGQVNSDAGTVNTIWKDTDTLWLRKTVDVTKYDIEAATLQLQLAHSGSITVYINGYEVYSSTSAQNTYKAVTIGSNIREKMVQGENVIAVKVTSSANSRFFGMSFLGIPSTGAGTVIGTDTLFNKGSQVSYYVSAQDELGVSGNWTAANFNTSSWKKQATPLGQRIKGEQSSDWSQEKPYIWIRYEFNISDVSKYSNAILKLNAFYDDDVVVYINGTKVYEDEGWNNGYTEYTLSGAAKYIVAGKNVVAVRLYQHTGGYEWDASLTADFMSGSVLSSNAPVSFENIPVNGDRMKKYFPLSYLVLTGSYAYGKQEWIGNTSNSYTNYISSMSQCEMLNPYAGGATKSAIIKKLRSGHAEISEEEIAAIACWIDLCVPCYGDYDPDASVIWDDNETRKAHEKDNKRHLYEVLDRCAKNDRAGIDLGEVKIEYGKSQVATGNGYAILYTKRNLQLSNTITITVPAGKKYIGFSLASRMGEAIMYCPDSKLVIKFPTSLTKVAPSTLTSYQVASIVARIVEEEELAKVHNLALNPYDFTDLQGLYPHAESNANSTEIVKSARNAIDGFVSNTSKDSFPTQAWEPTEVKADTYFKIDYGREVTLNEVVILMRNATSDTHFTSCTLEFSNGTKIDISLKDSPDKQSFDIGSVKTTYIKLTNFTVAQNDKKVAITEIETWGTENVK